MDLQENLPLTEATFFILLSLATSPRHGYAIMKEVKMLSESRVTLSTGTLYGAIKRMLDQGWIMRIDDPTGHENNRERKAYTLTPHGRQILNAEVERLGKLVQLAQFRLARKEV